MAAKTTAVQRPGTITLVMVLGVIAGLLNIASGIFVIIDRDEARLIRESGHTSDELLWAGIWAIIVGTVIVLVAQALGRGGRIARLLFGIFAVLNLAGGVYAAIAYSGEHRATGVVSAVFGIILLFLLYGTERDREYFAS